MALTRPVRTRTQYANQGLDRSSTEPLDLITKVVGIYSTAPTSHLALIARLDGYQPSHLDKLLFEDRSLVRMGAMRGSGYLVPTKLVPTIVRATEGRRARVFTDLVGKLMDRTTYDRLATKIEKLLAGREMTTAEIRKEMKDKTFDKHLRYVVQLMTSECRLVTTRTSGTWRSNLTYNALWSDWLPKVDPWKAKPDKAKADLAKLYFAAHGPATADDFAWWSGLRKDAAAGIERAQIPELGDGYFGPIDPARPAKGVRLLPIWDSAFLTHKDRSHVVGDEWKRHVYDASGNPTSVVMVNGMAAGQWDLTIQKSHHRVKVAPFKSFSEPTWKAVEKEVERLGLALDVPDIEVRRVKKAPSIADAEWNRFMSPLKDL
ncbi:MAG: hypothetical protein QOG04_386 [Actinomycetota bacterium]|jgi:hypothetical protein|nr:hypothetical protein [Actinomycetota bacterium]